MNSVKQAAEKLGVSEKTVRALVNAGRLEHHRIGVGRGTIRISDKTISDYLNSTRVEALVERSKKTTRAHRLKHLKL